MGLLRDGLYRMEFSPEALHRIAALTYAAPTFKLYYRNAMAASVTLVARRAKANAPVLTGTLRRAIRGQVLSPYQGRVGVLDTIPYARRREYGFDNQTDSRGRTFSNGDPLYSNPDKRSHMMYLHRAKQESLPEIAALWRSATTLAVKRVIL